MSMLDCPDDFHRENSSFSAFKKNRLHRDGRTDGRTDGPTDTTSYRDARTHLKMEKKNIEKSGNVWELGNNSISRIFFGGYSCAKKRVTANELRP